MWKITIALNVLIMILFWAASELAIAIAYNHLVQYPEVEGVIAFPVVTRMAFSMRKLSAVLPSLWVFISIYVYKATKHKPLTERNEYLLGFTSVTITAGLLIFVFWGLAGILPYLRIGAAI